LGAAAALGALGALTFTSLTGAATAGAAAAGPVDEGVGAIFLAILFALTEEGVEDISNALIYLLRTAVM
jgi:hypothetical protein